MERGAEALTDSDLLAILLGVGVRGNSVIQLANSLFRRLKRDGLSQATLADLVEERGIGKTKASIVLAAVELGKRLFGEDKDVVTIDGAESAYQNVRDLAPLKKEHLVALYLNAKNQLIKRDTVSIGSLFSNMVYPRELFGPALELRAAGVIMAHNHPSGDPEPSPEDLRLTQRMEEAALLLGIDLLDHLIVGHKKWISLRQRKVLHCR